MMLLDVYFIFEIIRKYLMHDLREDNDPIFKQGWMLPLSERYVRFISHIMWTDINHSNYFLYFTELIRD